MNKKYVQIAIFVILLFSGCKEGLDLFPKDTISDGTFWKTASDFKLAANNLYGSLEDFDTRDTQSDIAYSVPNSVSNGTYQTSETAGEWNTPYIYIRRCNNILKKVGESPIAGDVKQFAAEARFFRAYNYWLLFRQYGGVPLITEVLDINSTTLYAPRASRQETVDLILKDLTDAAVDLPEQKSLPSGDIGRVTKGAANSLKARVALFEGTWGKFRNNVDANGYLDIAIQASQSVMSSSQYALFNSKGNQSYRYLFIDEGDDSQECILDRRHQRDISGTEYTYIVGIGSLLPTKKLADMYLCADGLPITQSPLFEGYSANTSEYQNRDPRMTMTMLIPGAYAPRTWYVDPVASWPFYPQRNANTGYTTYKFLTEDKYANELQDDRCSFDFRLIRYAEVLLTYAEATFERNGSISDDDLNKSINIVRQRVNMPSLKNAFVSSNGLDMRGEIRRERTIELALEGYRYDDLRRWKTAEIELPQSIKGIKIVGSNWTDPVIIEGANRNPYADASWQGKTDQNGFIVAESAAERSFDPNKHYLRPLPTKEILINPDLQQNPGW
ncbi:outer membrane protein [Aquipluma nitroreducens]|uniref:Outer membrane protein n=1 Tax=Aquipluma nitroreducens TaxID=2010828 RepID=A0A5K7S3N2_9BACT|nr:RagB/SusD family nutrient uptake outer membrane protein [Aquipluma nitroreducens]BBE16181.1 outer membrane protein [Aquipluma nitroreducens]